MSSLCYFLLGLTVSLWSGDARFIVDPSSALGHGSPSSDLCSECGQIVQLSANMISGRDAKEMVYETLRALCQRLPEQQASACGLQVKAYLPKVLQQTPANQKPKETCAVFGLCGAKKKELVELPQLSTNKDTPTSSRTDKQLDPTCSFCLFIIKKLESLLPTNMTEETLMKLMEEICDLIPKSYTEQCEDFVAKYGREVVEFLLSSAAPHTICTLLHLCIFKEQTLPVPEALPASECDSCRTLAVLSRLHLAPNSTRPETSSFLQSVCSRHPNAIPKCEVFTKVFGSRLQEVLGQQMEGTYACERADLCVATRHEGDMLLGGNPCTWGPSYWCKNMKTAQRCGNQAFCEKHMWKE